MPSEDTADNELLYRLIGLSTLVGLPVAFGFVGMTALDSVVYGVVAGLMSGVGGALFLPWFMRLSAAQEEGAGDASFLELVREAPGRPERRLAGLGLDIGGIVMIALGFVVDGPDLLVGTAGGLLVASVAYLAASVGLDRTGATAGH